jgi:penicillin-binding protein 1C
LSKRVKILLISTGIIIIPVLLSRMPRFEVPFSTVVEASDRTLLGARIAGDGQWRFPSADTIPVKFEKAILTFEDRYFQYHPGINPVSLLRALKLNIKNHEVVSGGSTITMQVARLSAGNNPRTYRRKVFEMLSAVKLELFRSKKKILRMYVENAPFGGNCVGLEAASWRYAGKNSYDLTWAEAAALAILPNSPSLVFPGRNQEILRKKRDGLLRKLYERGFLDSLTFILAKEEPLPGEPKPLPALAPHLTDMFYLSERGRRIRTTIDARLQEETMELINLHQRELSGNFIFNAAALILKVESGEVLAYVGNTTNDNASDHGGNVDIIRSLRSTGSILKPFLYAGMQNSGMILPNTIIPDIPTRFPGFTPENFDRSFSGAVTAGSALSQSLNIPAVNMLRDFTPERFLELLRNLGFTTFTKTAGHYGLSLILGGGETSLWELTGAYASFSRILQKSGKGEKYYSSDFHPPFLTNEKRPYQVKEEKKESPLSASSVWLTYEALQNVNRPETESGWHYFSSARTMAWKTGTSFGFRDAWAVGTTPEYVIGVWIGNADGEGRPGLTGTGAAAPLLFDIAGILEPVPWFSVADSEMTTIRVCSKSGFRAGPDCPETIDIAACTNGLKSNACPYHKIVHLNRTGTFQVTTDCESPSDIKNESWFILPPAMEFYYRKKHPDYKALPPFAPGCKNEKDIPVMEFIYPTQGIRIFIPRDYSGNLTRIVAEVVHRNQSKKIFWHLDETYQGVTKGIHQIEILAGRGNHIITAVDDDGNSISCLFSILGKSD